MGEAKEGKGKRKAGFLSKVLGVAAWGLVISLATYFSLDDTILPGFKTPDFVFFLLVGVCWPVLWALTTLARVLLPMPFELGPILFELVLVKPGHLLAWVVFGKRSDEADEDEQPKAKPEEAPKPTSDAPAP
ncbi:MAG TPA: hypothetical protein DEA08_03955 [Planctomycetes bacterium]|nr:hypothetical protein [Planctomycetota bacterium]